VLGEPVPSRYLFGRRLIETLSALALRPIVFTDVLSFAAISDGVAPFVAIEISLRSSFNVNRPGLLPTMTRITPILDIQTPHLPVRGRPTTHWLRPRWQRPLQVIDVADLFRGVDVDPDGCSARRLCCVRKPADVLNRKKSRARIFQMHVPPHPGLSDGVFQRNILRRKVDRFFRRILKRKQEFETSRG